MDVYLQLCLTLDAGGAVERVCVFVWLHACTFLVIAHSWDEIHKVDEKEDEGALMPNNPFLYVKKNNNYTVLLSEQIFFPKLHF